MINIPVVPNMMTLHRKGIRLRASPEVSLWGNIDMNEFLTHRRYEVT